jgi:hypothetical protein
MPNRLPNAVHDQVERRLLGPQYFIHFLIGDPTATLVREQNGDVSWFDGPAMQGQFTKSREKIRRRIRYNYRLAIPDDGLSQWQ